MKSYSPEWGFKEPENFTKKDRSKATIHKKEIGTSGVISAIMENWHFSLIVTQDTHPGTSGVIRDS